MSIGALNYEDTLETIGEEYDYCFYPYVYAIRAYVLDAVWRLKDALIPRIREQALLSGRVGCKSSQRPSRGPGRTLLFNGKTDDSAHGCAHGT
jgi:hypothetical protein